MEILKQAFGPYGTNCYILKDGLKEWIIDPGMGASKWIEQECQNPVAILITHGHYDHIFDLARLKDIFPNLPIYCPKDDAFMLESDCFNTGLVPCKPDHLIFDDSGICDISLEGKKFSFYHLPGHTPGCSIIEVEGHIFSGDFIFKRSIGRYDFPYSDAKLMRDSLLRFSKLELDKNTPIHPGHGEDTTLGDELIHIPTWIARI